MNARAFQVALAMAMEETLVNMHSKHHDATAQLHLGVMDSVLTPAQAAEAKINLAGFEGMIRGIEEMYRMVNKLLEMIAEEDDDEGR